MPSSSSSSLSAFKSLLSTGTSPQFHPANQPAFITFSGPDSSSQIVAANASGQPVAHFLVSSSKGLSSKYTISRLQKPHQPNQICELQRSSLSGTTHLHVHGQEIRLAKNHLDMSGHDSWKMETAALGIFKWAKGTIKGITLSDHVGTIVAKGSLSNKQLDVFVQADEVLLDIIMAAWVALVKDKAAAEKEAKGAMEIVEALAGA